MISLHLTIDKRRNRKDGSYPIIFRVSYNGLSRSISTNLHCKEQEWSIRTKNIKEFHHLFNVIAPRLKELEVFYLDKIIEYQKLFPLNQRSIQSIKDFLISKPNQQVDIISFWKEEIELLHKSNKNGNAIIYNQSLTAINKISPLNISFELIDYKFLRDLEAELVAKGLKTNSISLYLRTFRAVYNKARKSKIIGSTGYPFIDFIIKKGQTKPRPMTLDEIIKYFNFNLPESSTYFESWLIGKLIFLLIGINFKDILLLNETNIRNGRLVYFRAKTHKMYSVKLLPEAQGILNYFLSKKGITLLDRLKEEDLLDKKKLPFIVKQKNKVFNSHVNKIGILAGVNIKLTSYVFRYTWANIAKQQGYSKDLIAEALGHEYGNKVTGIYLEAYDKDLIDEMNLRICDKITLDTDTL